MKFNSRMLVGLVSAVFVVGSATAQVKKSTPSKPTSGRSVPQKTTAAGPATAPGRMSVQDSVSYSIGLFMAQSIQQQGIEGLNSAMLTRGLEDALKGQKTQLSLEQAGLVMNSYMHKQSASRGAENRKAGDAFLAENKAKAGVTTTASGLQYTVEKQGTGAKPTATDRVKVHYTGRLLDGKVFDSSVERGEPTEFPVNGVIRGWTEALQLMPVGSKWKLYIPAELAYGDRGAGQEIKPGSTLVFDVELLDIIKSNQPEAVNPGLEETKPATNVKQN